MHRRCEDHGITNGVVMLFFNKPPVAGECRPSTIRRQLTRAAYAGVKFTKPINRLSHTRRDLAVKRAPAVDALHAKCAVSSEFSFWVYAGLAAGLSASVALISLAPGFCRPMKVICRPRSGRLSVGVWVIRRIDSLS
jgi:hypothetical protein